MNKIPTFAYCKKQWIKMDVGNVINADDLFQKAIPKKEKPNRNVSDCASFLRIMVANGLGKRQVINGEMVVTKVTDDEALTTEELRIKTETFYAIQEDRIKESNRVKAFVREGRLTAKQAKTLHGWHDDHTRHLEKEIEADIKRLVRRVGIWDYWLKDVLGIGHCLAGSLYAAIQDIGRFDTVAKLWKQAGQHVVFKCPKCGTQGTPELTESVAPTIMCNGDAHTCGGKLQRMSHIVRGKRLYMLQCDKCLEVLCPTCIGQSMQGEAPRREKGKKIDHDPFLRTTCWKIANQFVRTGPKSPYANLYAEKKAYYLQKYPEWQVCRKCGTTMKKLSPLEMQKHNSMTLCENCGGKQGGVPHPWRKDKSGAPIHMHTLGHIDAMAKRYIIKIFLQHLWLKWRELDELPVSHPWIIGRGRHGHYITPDGERVDVMMT